MFNIIPLLLILISLAVIMVIVVRKFSVLANLDIETIQAEREAKFKEQIISNRIKRTYYKYYGKLMKIFRPPAGLVSVFFIWSYKKLVEFKNNYNKENLKVKTASQQISVNKLFLEADDLAKAGEYDKLESKYIEIIGLDSKNYWAFKELGKLYFERKDYNEAKQTFEHALKLLEHENMQAGKSVNQGNGYGQEKNINIETEVAELYYEMACVCQAMQNSDGALLSIGRALSIEPNNPRYLDTKLEISIMKKDKISAMMSFEKLQEVNPENQKLKDWEKQISEL